MKVRHRYMLNATCPVNGDPDRYTVDAFVTEGVLYCEQVRDTCEAVAKTPKTQEELTQEIADLLGVKVRTRGTHCRGAVETVVICKPRVATRAAA